MEFKIRLPVLILCTIKLIVAVEEAEPEVFLPPRNFNPHPYELGYDPSQRHVSRGLYGNQIDVFAQRNTGPVLFPSNRDGARERNPFAPAIKEDHPVNRHPYAGVAKKKKYRLGLGRFANEDPINPQVFKALANHGAKVLRVPQAKDLKNVRLDPAYSNQKKNYAFSYKVVDHLTGDDFSHSQSQNSQATNGEYRVKLPDGRLQIVSYTADKNGYKADVTYQEDEGIKAEKSPEVYNYPDYDGLAEKPFYYEGNGEFVDKYLLPEKDFLYGNIHEEKVVKFIGSTLAPYTAEGSTGLGRNVGGSTLAPDLDNFNPIYINAPKYKLTLQEYKK